MDRNNTPPDDGTIQDLKHRLRAGLHYGLIHFKQWFSGMVKAGLLIRACPEIAQELPAERAKAYAALANRYFDCDEFTREEWESLEDQWLNATITWVRFLDPHRRPSKRHRARTLLKRNPLAMIALFSLQSYQEDQP